MNVHCIALINLANDFTIHIYISHNSFPLNYLALILCYKNWESIDIIVIMHFNETSTASLYKDGSQL